VTGEGSRERRKKMIKNSYSRTKGAHGCCVLFYICPIRGPLPRYVTPEQKKNEKKKKKRSESRFCFLSEIFDEKEKRAGFFFLVFFFESLSRF
jgi:hypothetical protein